MVVPPKHPKMIIFNRKTPRLLGTTILGNPHILSTGHLIPNSMASCGHQRLQETKREIRAALKKIRTMPQSGMGICGFQNDGDSDLEKTLENSKQHVGFFNF